jgi:GTP cyclohydrolase I
MTREIADTLMHYLNPLGVAVVTEARHMCMMMRGVEKQNSVATASAMLGAFKEPKTRSEFMTLVGNRLS